MVRFPVSGVECAPWLPPLVAFAIACATTPAGVSGAFLLLPFQMSVLGFASPAASATNLIYNIVAIPGGVYRYTRERRMAWPLAWTIIAGTLPGAFAGAWLRTRYLADPRYCRIFVGVVLLYLGVRLLAGRGKAAARPESTAEVKTLRVGMDRMEYAFAGRVYGFRPAAVLGLAVAVGVVGGIYGVGGGAIIAPFAVAMLGLPVYTVAGAALLGTFVTSAAGVGFFAAMGTRADWLLGALFGLGGLAGTYTGARLQRHLPERWIRLILGGLVSALGLAYLF
jgi:uncharacterized membrane protein YfcA